MVQTCQCSITHLHLFIGDRQQQRRFYKLVLSFVDEGAARMCYVMIYGGLTREAHTGEERRDTSVRCRLVTGCSVLSDVFRKSSAEYEQEMQQFAKSFVTCFCKPVITIIQMNVRCFQLYVKTINLSDEVQLHRAAQVARRNDCYGLWLRQVLSVILKYAGRCSKLYRGDTTTLKPDASKNWSSTIC